MGNLLSCCGLGDDGQDDYLDRQHERTPLLQDPTAILQQPRPEPTPADQQRDQEALARIVDRTTENLINIQSTFDWRRNGQSMDATEKAAHYKYLIERLENNRGQSHNSPEVDNQVAGDASDEVPDQIVLAPDGPTPAEAQLLDNTIKLFEEALEEELKVKPVGDVFVKLNWD